jgi:hypothetical protein
MILISSGLSPFQGEMPNPVNREPRRPRETSPDRNLSRRNWMKAEKNTWNTERWGETPAYADEAAPARRRPGEPECKPRTTHWSRRNW